MCHTISMKNTHLEHPEDNILNNGKEGAKTVLKFFQEKNSKLSVKYDGSPAIVWGRNPENDKFFVGTKSVFNKVKVKINYTHHDIELNHGHTPEVASILHMCLVSFQNYSNMGVFQSDFIGFAGTNEYNPNTITYKFDEEIDSDKHNIVVATHSHYVGDEMKSMDCVFNTEYTFCGKAYNLNTNAELVHRHLQVGLWVNVAKTLIPFVKFPDIKEGKKIKQVVNQFIRERRELTANALAKETGFSANLFHLYNIIREIKLLLMTGINPEDSTVECYIGDEIGGHEGYVMSNVHGTYKLIDRQYFSYANFTVGRQRKMSDSK